MKKISTTILIAIVAIIVVKKVVTFVYDKIELMNATTWSGGSAHRVYVFSHAQPLRYHSIPEYYTKLTEI